MQVKVAGFVEQFRDKKAPSQHDDQKLHFVEDGAHHEILAGRWLAGVRHNWHVVDEWCFRTTDAQKDLLRTLSWWTEPEPPKKRAEEPYYIVHLHAEFPEIVATLKMPKTDTKTGTKAGKALSAWKSNGMPNKEQFDAVLVKLLATIPDADRRAKVQTLFDNFAWPKVVAYLRACLDHMRVTGTFPPSTDKEHGGAGFSNWKRQGYSHKAEVETFLAQYLAKIPDAEERAMLQAGYDDNVKKRSRGGADPEGAKKARVWAPCVVAPCV